MPACAFCRSFRAEGCNVDLMAFLNVLIRTLGAIRLIALWIKGNAG